NPPNIPNIATKIPIKITPLKLLLKRIEIAAGKIRIAATSKAPTIGIIIAIVTPVMILKAKDIALIGRPAVKAVSSSKVNTYIGRLKKKYNKIITTVIPNKNQICSFVIVTIEPNKKLFKLITLLSLKLINTRARAIPPDIIMAIEISEYDLYTLRRYSSKTEATTTTKRFIHVGEMPNNRPKATPTNEMCERVSAKRVWLLNMRNKPNIGAINEIKKDA